MSWDYEKITSYKTSVVVAETGRTEITYYDTVIVSFDDSGICLNTGGFWTVTTQSRMNQVSRQFNLGYRVYRKGKKWFVELNKASYPFVTEIITLSRNEQKAKLG